MTEFYMIIVTGSPGTGKTQVARILADDLGAGYFSSSKLLGDLGATRPDPTGRRTSLIREEGVELACEVLRKRGKPAVVETVYPDLWIEAGGDDVVFVVLLRTDPFELYSRLVNRSWPLEKVAENVLAEILGVVAGELADYWHMVFEVDTTGKRAREVVDELYESVSLWRVGLRIDWLAREDVSKLAVKLESGVNFDKYWLGYSG